MAGGFFRADKKIWVIFCKKIPLNRCYVFFLQEKIAEGDSMTEEKIKLKARLMEQPLRVLQTIQFSYILNLELFHIMILMPLLLLDDLEIC